MHELFLLLLLFLAPFDDAEVHFISADEIALRLGADPCEAARVIAEQGACTRAEDCGAFDGWMRLFGEPGNEPLDPDHAERREISRRPPSFPCPAVPGTSRTAPSRERGPRRAPAVPGR